MGLSRGQFLILILVLLSPFLFFPKIFNPYETPRFLFFVFGAEILAVLFALDRIRNKKFEVKLDFPTFLILGFLLINLIADIFGLDPKISLLGTRIRYQGFLTLLSGAILFFITRYYFNSKGVSFFKKAVLIVAFLISLASIWQGVQFNFFHNFVQTYNGRIVGTFGNPNFLGGYLVTLLPFILFSFARPRLAKLGVKIVLVFLVLAAIFFTKSYSSFIALFFILLIYLFLKIRQRLFFKILTIFIAVFILGLSSFLLTKSNAQKQMIMTETEKECFYNWPNDYPWKIVADIYKNNISFFGRSSPCDNRLVIWISGLKKLSERPVLGFGQENFEFVIPDERLYRVDNAHNIFLETLVSSGIFGLLFYMAFIVYFLKKADLDIKLAIIVFLITAQFNPLSIAQIILFWFLLGISGKKRDG